MANFFEPSNAKGTETSTPSPASQALSQWKAGILGQLLDAGSKRRPSFNDFARGGSQLPARLPGGLSAGIPALLQAMQQPGAFTSSRTSEGQGVTPSTFSDVAQLGGLLGLLYQSGALGAGANGLSSILSGVGGALGIGGTNQALGDNIPSADANQSQGAAQNLGLESLYQGANPAAGGSYGVLQSDAGNGADTQYLAALLGLI